MGDVSPGQESPEGGSFATLFDGHIDGVDDSGSLFGWASAAQPGVDARLLIEIDGAIIHEVVADQFREDLIHGGLPNPSCAFWYPVPDALRDGRDHVAALIFAASGQPLRNSPLRFRLDRPDPIDRSCENLIPNAAFTHWPAGLQVAVDARFTEFCAGWLFDRAAPSPARIRCSVDKAGDLAVGPDAYGLRIDIERAGADERLQILVPIAFDPAQLGALRLSLGVQRPAQAGPDALHIAEIALGASSEGTLRRFCVVRRTLNGKGTQRLLGVPVPAAGAGEALGPREQCVLAIALAGNGAITLFAPALGRAPPPPAETVAVIGAFEDPAIQEQIGHLQLGPIWSAPLVAVAGGPGEAPTPIAPPAAVRGHAGIPFVQIVVPVYNAAGHVEDLLRSIRASTPSPYEILLFDDGSDRYTGERLARWEAIDPRIRYHRQPANLGYTRNVNIALQSSVAAFVVLINSDTIVTANWLAKLYQALVADELTAAAGPLSNAASWQSIPRTRTATGAWMVNAFPEKMTPDDVAALVERLSPAAHPAFPLLNGFCTLFRRAALDAVGFFDDAAFPEGYGEENDLCLRLARLGYRLRVADDVYVHHKKSISFGRRRRAALAQRATMILRAKHPEIWANESWSRRWDGSDAETLLEQAYPPDLPDRLAADLVRYFRDPRYRRIDGRPLLVIYRASAVPPAALAALRAACAALGEQVLIYLAQTFEDEDPRCHGLDGALEFPPHKISRGVKLAMPERSFGANPALKVWDYDAFVAGALRLPAAPYPLIRTCFPSWDNDSRRQGAGSVIHGSTPARFGRWLEALIDAAERVPRATPIVCINAWNEWGEGAYLEPDRHFGYAYLNIVQAALHPPPSGAPRQILLVGHDAFAAGAQRLLLHLGESLAETFGVTLAFVLLRADAGHDALLDRYRAIAETHVAGADAAHAAALARLLADRGFSHAIVNSAASAAFLAPLAAAGIAILQLVHELPTMLATLGAGAALVRAAAHGARFVAPTAAIAAMLTDSGIAREAIGIRPQGCYRAARQSDPRAARAALGLGEARSTIVASLGFADRRKGADLFVATAEAAQRAGEAMLFVWQGGWDAALSAELGGRLAALAAGGRVRLLPEAPAVNLLLAAADIFFLPSREDPLPTAAIEAWSCGLAVVAIRAAGGVADLIAAQPELGQLAAQPEPDALLAALRAAAPAGRSQARADWAAAHHDWPSYVRFLLHAVTAPPSLDVAIVGHDQACFAERRIASIARQTLVPRSIAYFDIASSAGDRATIAAAARRYGVPLIARDANDGRLFETWAEIAAGSEALFLHIAEGDDWIAPTMLARCCAALEQAPRAAYAFCAVTWIDRADQPIADHSRYPADVIGADIAAGGEITAERLLGSDLVVKNPILTVSSVVWRRTALLALIDANRAALATLDFAYDWLIYLRAAQAGHSAHFVAESLCRHRQHGGSFAARSDLARHRAEIGRIHKLQPAPGASRRRAAYRASLG